MHKNYSVGQCIRTLRHVYKKIGKVSTIRYL